MQYVILFQLADAQGFVVVSPSSDIFLIPNKRAKGAQYNVIVLTIIISRIFWIPYSYIIFKIKIVSLKIRNLSVGT